VPTMAPCLRIRYDGSAPAARSGASHVRTGRWLELDTDNRTIARNR
jgi:hypothetical protein